MYTGSILIRFRHPSRDLTFLSSLLGLSCSRNWKSGSPRQTPTGSPLSGTYPESYWVAQLDFPSEEGFGKKLLFVLDLLIKAKETLNEIRESGGKIEIYLQLSGAVNNGDTIKSTFLNAMGELGIDLLVEVFIGV